VAIARIYINQIVRKIGKIFISGLLSDFEQENVHIRKIIADADG